MSAPADLIDPAQLREQLARISCGACAGPLDEHAHRALYVSPTGELFPHLVCGECWAGSHAEVAEKVELRFLPAEGCA